MGGLLVPGGAERGPSAEVCGLTLCALIWLLSLLSSPHSLLPFCHCSCRRLCLPRLTVSPPLLSAPAGLQTTTRRPKVRRRGGGWRSCDLFFFNSNFIQA